jgi:hypothetical protein
MCRFYCNLIEVTTCVGFTVFNLFSDIDIKKRFNAQNWILTSAELKIQCFLNLLPLYLQCYMNTFITNYSLVNHFLLIYTIR